MICQKHQSNNCSVCYTINNIITQNDIEFIREINNRNIIDESKVLDENKMKILYEQVLHLSRDNINLFKLLDSVREQVIELSKEVSKLKANEL